MAETVIKRVPERVDNVYEKTAATPDYVYDNSLDSRELQTREYKASVWNASNDVVLKTILNGKANIGI